MDPGHVSRPDAARVMPGCPPSTHGPRSSSSAKRLGQRETPLAKLRSYVASDQAVGRKLWLQ
jgi:hypothetical protein